MPKITKVILMFVIAVALAGCNKNEKIVREFGIEFGEMVQNNDEAGIRSVYPGLGNYSDMHLTFHRDNIDIFPEGGSRYKIRYEDGANITVRLGLRGAVEVIDSEGIFEKKEDKTSKKNKTSKKSSNSYFNDGYNKLEGKFNYQGSDYGFSVSFDYDTSTHIVTNAIYKTVNGAGMKISSMRISSNERTLSIYGNKLEIEATGSPGSYSGDMIRGDHIGTCRLTLSD